MKKIWIIARKELLSNLMTLKFAVGILLCLILVLLFTYVLMEDYQQELYMYTKSVSKNKDEMGQIRVYRNLKPIAYKPPQVLSIFSQGLEKHLGSSVLISLREMPVLRSAYTTSNPLLSVFPLLDFSLIFKVVMTILALLLAYNAISGEKEDGTLSLMLSNSVPRYRILLGKFLGGLLSLTAAISIGFLAGMILLQSSSMVSLTSSIS